MIRMLDLFLFLFTKSTVCSSFIYSSYKAICQEQATNFLLQKTPQNRSPEELKFLLKLHVPKRIINV